MEHEIISLARAYSNALDTSLDLNALSAMAQESLRKNNFEAFDHLQRLFVHHDDDRNGVTANLMNVRNRVIGNDGMVLKSVYFVVCHAVSSIK